MPARNPECVDCKAERERRGLPYPKYPRPIARDSGGRCATHRKQHLRYVGSGRGRTRGLL